MTKKLLILTIILIGLVSCEQKNINSKPSGYVIYDGYELETVVIDSCEYLFYFKGNNVSFFTHKGNCKNHKQLYYETAKNQNYY